MDNWTEGYWESTQYGGIELLTGFANDDLKTIEKKKTVPNPYGYEADTLSTRVIYNRPYDEYMVLVYLDGDRYEDGDYFADDKDDAIGTASAMREGNFGRKVTA